MQVECDDALPRSAQAGCSVQVDGTDLDLFVIFQEVARRGGYEAVTISRRGFQALPSCSHLHAGCRAHTHPTQLLHDIWAAASSRGSHIDKHWAAEVATVQGLHTQMSRSCLCPFKPLHLLLVSHTIP